MDDRRTALLLIAAATLALLAMAFVSAGAAEAAQPTDRSGVDTAPLEEIVVVATKYRTALRDVAADVTAITRQDLEETLTATLPDMFRFVPGVSHEGAGSRFGAEGVSIRGIGGNRVALEIDGVPVSEQFAIGSFSHATRDFIDPALIGRVEILRGPASALYGSSALGGVVAVRTRGALAADLDAATAGDAGLVRHGRDDSSHLTGGMHWARADGGLALSVAGAHREGGAMESAAAEGPADQRDWRRDAGLVGLAGSTAADHEWRLTLLRQSADVTSDIRATLGEGRFAATTSLTGDDRSAFTLASGEYRLPRPLPWLDEALLRVFHAEADVQQDTVDERAAAAAPVRLAREFDYEQRLVGGELNLWRELEAGGWSHRLGFGAEWTERETAEMRDGVSQSLVDGSVSRRILGEEFPLRDFPVTVTRELGLWLSDQVSKGPLTLSAALRYDENRLDPEPDAVYREDNPAVAPVAVAVSDVSPKLGIVYRAGADTDLFLQYARGFRAPPFEDANIGLDIPLFNIRALPNPELRSETSDGWEAGLRWEGRRARLAFAAFQTDYDDFIETKARIGVDPASGRLLFQSRNIDRARIRGVEARGSLRPGGRLRGLMLEAAAYLAEGENRITGEPLGSVGPAQAVLGARWRSHDDRTGLRAVLTLTDGWSGQDDAEGERFEPAGYGVVDLYATRRLGDHLTLTLGIGNLTDRCYWRWADVSGLTPDDPVLPMLAQPGRHYSIGLQWDW